MNSLCFARKFVLLILILDDNPNSNHAKDYRKSVDDAISHYKASLQVEPNRLGAPLTARNIIKKGEVLDECVKLKNDFLDLWNKCHAYGFASHFKYGHFASDTLINILIALIKE
jgi:hypothetical protein